MCHLNTLVRGVHYFPIIYVLQRHLKQQGAVTLFKHDLLNHCPHRPELWGYRSRSRNNSEVTVLLRAVSATPHPILMVPKDQLLRAKVKRRPE